MTETSPTASGIHADTGNSPITTPTPPSGPKRDHIKQATDLLRDNRRIGLDFDGYDKRRIYVPLNHQRIFDALVPLYASLFQSQWKDFKRAGDNFTAPGNHETSTSMAYVYISHWFIDLIVTLMDACYSISHIAFSEHYNLEFDAYSDEYDAFLQGLNLSIRPTRIQGDVEDILYIPIFKGDEIDMNNQDNPLHITGFRLHEELFHSIINTIKEKKTGWNMVPLSKDTTGRPSWLLDWHSNGKICSWFPFEDNLDLNDATMAFILGVACTPNLGPRDYDEWQIAPGGQPIAADTPVHTIVRQTERAFFGNYEVRTLERAQHIMDSTPRQTTPRGTSQSSKRSRRELSIREPQASSAGQDGMIVQITLNRYRLIDWVYYYRVNVNLSERIRKESLRKIVLTHQAQASK